MNRIAVALLVLAPLALLAPPGPPARALEDLAPAMPADAAVYVRAKGLDTLLAELASSKLVADGTILRTVYEDAIGAALEDLAEETEIPLEEIRAGVASVRGAHFALMGVGRRESDLDMLIALETDKPDAFRKLAAKAEQKAGEHSWFAGEVAGARVMAMGDEDFTLYYAIHEGIVFAATRPERISAALEARVEPPERSLANQPAYRAGALPAADETVFAYADVARTIGLIASVTRGRDAEDFQQAARILHLDQIHTVSAASGHGETRARIHFDADHPWLAAVRGAPGPGVLKAFVPADCFLFGIDSGPIAKKWRALKRLLGDEQLFPEAKDFNEATQEAAKALGFTFDELADALGAEWMIGVPLTEGGTRIDDDALLFAATIKDREKFDALLAKFRQGEAAQKMEKRGRGLVSEPYAGYEILHEKRENSTRGFCMAVVEDTLVFSGELTALKAALDAKTKGPTMTGRSGRFLAPLPRTSSKLFVMDVGTILWTEREFVPLLDLVADGAVLAAALDEEPGRIDVRVNVSAQELAGLLAAGELFEDRYRAERQACTENLEAIGAAIRKYRDAHGGESPPSLEALAGTYLPKARLVCPLDKGKEGVRVSYEHAMSSTGNDWRIDAWCPHRLHGRLALFANGNTTSMREESFLRYLRRQGVRPR